MDMIFTAQQLQDKCQEQHKPFYMAFIDLAKTFDSVNHKVLWKTLSKASYPVKFINILHLLHDKMLVMVLTDSNMIESYDIETGVKQGCVFTINVLSIFTTIPHLVKKKLPSDMDIVY
eukprot:g37485.t1